MEKKLQNKILRLVRGDITKRESDVIVNAANSYLKHGGGVARAIVQKGGKIIQEESDKIGFVPVGSATITSSGSLTCKAVIHAVGPRMGEGDEDSKLKKTVQSSLRLASVRKFNTISIPAISSGIFGFPKDRCAKILVNESKNFIEKNPDTSIDVIEFCILEGDTYSFFKKELEDLF